MMLAGVVLCGGKSTRMGRDKALIEVQGRPLVALVAERLASVADPVLLASGDTGRYPHLGYPEVTDSHPDAGPLGGLIATLRESPHDLVAAAAVDMPFISPSVLLKLQRLHLGEDAVVPVTAEGIQPLHALYSKSALPKLEAALAEGKLSLKRLIADLSVREVHEHEWRSADSTGRFAVNLNEAGDLRLLEGDAE